MLRVRGTLARVDGALVVTEPKTAKSRRSVPLSSTAQRVLREVHTSQAEERLRAGSAWQQTGYVFTTELGTPYEPRVTPCGPSRRPQGKWACPTSVCTRCATLRPR